MTTTRHQGLRAPGTGPAENGPAARRRPELWDRVFWFLSRGGVETYLPDDIKTRFADVWGQDHVVERVRENIVFLERPDEIEARGGYVPGGLLLWGPPGTGKTLMAEAVAGETGKPYVFVHPGAFTGIGILKVKSLFRKLRRLALRYGGVIVFFDQADSLGRRGRLAQQALPGQGLVTDGCHGLNYLSEQTRAMLTNRFITGGGTGGGQGDTGTLQALLTELSGLRKPRGFGNRLVRRLLGRRPKPPPSYRILVMMATNLPDVLHEALLRPGRIDRVYKVGYPSKSGRVRTYQGYFAKVDHALSAEQIDKLATITPYATGATIKDLVNESLITAIRDGRQTITWPDVLRAKRLKQLGPPGDVERERHAVAVHEACHAVVAYRTRFHLEIDIATIEKGADYLGMVASIKPEDRFTRWKSEHEADIMVSLASLAGERMFFGDDNSAGVCGDLMSATYLVGLMESHWGMGAGIASLPALQELGIMAGRAVRTPAGPGFTQEAGSSRDNSGPGQLSERVEVNLARLLDLTEELLREHRREVLCLAHALETHKTLNGDDVVAILEGRRGPLVDGTVYRSEELFADLEEYHDDAARAHREHSHVARTLPVPLLGPVPVLEPVLGLGPVPVLEPVLVGTVEPPLPQGAAIPLGPAPYGPPSGGPAGALSPGAPPWGAEPAGVEVRPEFVPWAPESRSASAPVFGERTAAHPAPPREAKPGRGVLVIIGSLLALVAFALFGAMAVTGAGIGPVSPTLMLVLLIVVITAIVGVGVMVITFKGVRVAHSRAEQDRDRANARAQLLAAAMDPETAMRLLGYDGRHGPDDGIRRTT